MKERRGVINHKQREGLLEKIISYHNSRSSCVEKIFGGCLSGRGFIYITLGLKPVPLPHNLLDMTLKEDSATPITQSCKGEP